MTLRDGLKGLRALRKEEGQEKQEEASTEHASAAVSSVAAPAVITPAAGNPPPTLPAAASAEKREAFTSRLRPSQRLWLRQETLRIEALTGARVTIEDILEALLEEVQSDDALRARVTSRLS